MTSEEDVTETLNNHFIESVKALVDNDSCSAYITENSRNTDPIANIIEKFRYHPSILSIKRKAITTNFSFQYFSEEDISSEIKNLNKKKASTGMPIKFLKENSDILSGKLKDIFNNCLDQATYFKTGLN